MSFDAKSEIVQNVAVVTVSQGLKPLPEYTKGAKAHWMIGASMAKLAANAAMAKVGILPRLPRSFDVKWRGQDISRPYENHIIGRYGLGYILEEHFVTF